MSLLQAFVNEKSYCVSVVLLFQDWAHLIAVLELKVVPLGVILRGHFSLPGYGQHLELI